MENNNTQPAPAPVKQRRISCLSALSILAVLIIVVFMSILLFIAPIMRTVFSHVEAQSGITITFDRAYFTYGEGPFLSFDGLNIHRQNHREENYDLRAANVQVPIMFPADIYAPILFITGLRGTYEKVSDAPTKEDEQSNSFHIAQLHLKDVEIEYIDRTLIMPFQTTVMIEESYAIYKDKPVLFEPYLLGGEGKLGPAKFEIKHNKDDLKQTIELTEIPYALLTPYAPVLKDIFASGGMNVSMKELSDDTQKKVRISITLLPNSVIKPADEILAPAIQAMLNKLDQSSIQTLRDIQGNIDRLKKNTESLHAQVNEVAMILDTLKALAPRDVREKYENFKSKYDRAMASYDDSKIKFDTLLRELDQVKLGIVNDTFQYFIKSGVPIEIDLQQVDGQWQYDGYEIVSRLIEKNYQALINDEYKKRIKEVQDSVERMLTF